MQVAMKLAVVTSHGIERPARKYSSVVLARRRAAHQPIEASAAV